MSPKKQIDWIGIENEYRVGQLSNCSIAAQFGISETAIRKKAKRKGWTKDLALEVQQRVRKKLDQEPHVSKGEIVEEASDRGVQVILSHRKDIQNLRTLEQKLLNELSGNPTKLYITQYQGDIVEKEVGLTVNERAGALRDLARVQQTRITLERQAFNLDEEKPPDPSEGKTGFVYENLLAAIICQRKTITSGTKELTDGNNQGQ
jgi:hypothetical protein